MKKAVFIVIFFISNCIVFSQLVNSIQLKGGMIFPSASQNGIQTSIEAAHSLNNNWSLYSSIGFSHFDRNTIYTNSPWGNPSSYSEDSHKLYIVTFGSELVLNRIKSFLIYANFEFGFNYLQYNLYNMFLAYDEITRKVISFHPDISSKTKTSESLFGLGFGLGFKQQLSTHYGFSIELKRIVLTKKLDYFRHYFTLDLGFVYTL